MKTVMHASAATERPELKHYALRVQHAEPEPGEHWGIAIQGGLSWIRKQST